MVNISIGQAAQAYHDVPVTVATNHVLNMPVSRATVANVYNSKPDTACNCFNDTRRTKRIAICG